MRTDTKTITIHETRRGPGRPPASMSAVRKKKRCTRTGMRPSRKANTPISMRSLAVFRFDRSLGELFLRKLHQGFVGTTDALGDVFGAALEVSLSAGFVGLVGLALAEPVVEVAPGGDPRAPPRH